MWLVSAYSPLTVALPWRSAMALTFFSVGLATALAGVVSFRQAKTTVNPLIPDATTAMVTSGIYRFSRNPMYLGLFLALVGWATYLSHLLAFALPPLAALYMQRLQTSPAESTVLSTRPHEP